MNILGKNISDYRRQKRLTRNALADRTGIKLHILRELEYGSIPKNIAILLPLITNALGVTLNQIFGIQSKKKGIRSIAIEIERLSKKMVSELDDN